MIKKHIPNSITMINLFCGCCAVVALLHGQHGIGIGLVIGAALADFLDGAVARWLQVDHPLGKNLDSLADMVSFGLVPGVIGYQLLADGQQGIYVPALPAFLLTVFAALRLAKFNNDSRQSTDFIGLPTPACTLFMVGLLLIDLEGRLPFAEWVLHPLVVYTCTGLLSWLLVAEIPMFSLKIENWKWEGNTIRIIFGAIALALLFALGVSALAIIVVVYIFLSIIQTK